MTFEPFSQAKLDNLLIAFPVSEAGATYIAKAMEAPTGNAQGSTKKVRSDLACPKMRMNMQSDMAAFLPLIRELIFDRNCIGYVTRPPAIEIAYAGKNGHAVRTMMRPACLSFDAKEGSVIEEWMPANYREKLDEMFPGRYVKEANGNFSSPPISSVLRPMGLTYRVRFKDEVSEVADLNRKYLKAYLFPEASKTMRHEVEARFRVLVNETCWDYTRLINVGLTEDDVNFALAVGMLHFDIEHAELMREKPSVMVFRTPEQVQAWKMASRPMTGRPMLSDASKINELTVGERFSFDGISLKVSMPGSNCLHATTDAGEFMSLPYALLLSPENRGKLVLPTVKGHVPAPSALWSSSPGTLDRAIRHVLILQRIDAGEALTAEQTYSASTIRRWRKLVREGDAFGWTPVESLLDAGEGKGFKGPHIDQQLSIDINALVALAIKDNKQPNVAAMFTDVQKSIEATGRRMLVKSSFYERVARARDLASLGRSHGHKVQYQHSPTYWMLGLDTPTHCQRALELVHFDSTLLDVEVRSSLSGDALWRPWLSLAVCAHTRKIVGFYLSFRPPSYVSSMMLVADIIHRSGRVPESIIHDHGSEFKATTFNQMLTSLMIDRHVRPKSEPRFGAILERMFGIVTSELLSGIAGNTKSRKQVRQLTAAVDASAHSGLTLMDLASGLEDYFFNIYNKRKHPTTLRVPDQLFESSLISGGFRKFRMKRRDDVLPVLAPTARGKPHILDPVRGISLNYLYYGHPELAKLSLAKSELVVKVIPWDPGFILCHHEGRWLECRSRMYTELRQVPEFVRQCVFEEWLAERKLTRDSHADAARETRELIDRMNLAAQQHKEYFKDREFRRFLSYADFNTHAANHEYSDDTAEADVEECSSKERDFAALVEAANAALLGSGDYGQVVGASH